MHRCDDDLKLQACENGRGAVLLSVARGKVSEGIDFGELLLKSTKISLTHCTQICELLSSSYHIIKGH